jgi:uncharacterized membrane protein
MNDGRVVRLWASVGGVSLAALLVGVVAAPGAVYDGVLWRYLWGPVVADAHGAVCAIRTGGGFRIAESAEACGTAAEAGRIVATPGYTLVSEAVYAATLLYALVGVWVLLRRLGLGTDRRFVGALVPFVLFGGALRTVEDTLDAAAAPPIGYPLNTLLISPLIYVTVFAVTIGALLLARRRWGAAFHRPLAGVGGAAVVATLAGLVVLSTDPGVTLRPAFAVVSFGGAALLAGTVWWAVRRYAPSAAAGPGTAGALVVWAHAVDGLANVVGLDWGAELGYPGGDLVPKHPINRIVVDASNAVLPDTVVGVIGDAWPFLLLKIGVAIVVVWAIDERFIDEQPRYAVLLLVAVIAVGLGPGTRNALRMTFGV